MPIRFAGCPDNTKGSEGRARQAVLWDEFHNSAKQFDHSRIMKSTAAAVGFAALAQVCRLSIIRQLAQNGQAGLAAGDLADALGMPASTLSFHLAALAKAGLVRSSRSGRNILYRVRFSGLRALYGYLTETCCSGRPDLCADLSRLLPDDAQQGLETMTPAFNVLFLCTHNSARSLMAQTVLEKIGQDKFNSYSAGSHPAATPMPEVIDKLRALGHDTSGLHCKTWDTFSGLDAPRMDFVIALCDTLEGQHCPDFGANVLTASWPLPDPWKFTGTPAEKATMINELYGMVRRRLEIFVNLPHASLDRLAMKQRLDALGDSTRPPV
ncbi:MAG: metalloregulator ArsR/SmtB family transcription factor [Proteobacteria bacterium]|nr:metalloregulator ArsR/SmtB family transcription factor [Pseudomonadota bacterium]